MTTAPNQLNIDPADDDVAEGVTARPNVAVTTYDADLLTYAEPCWPALPAEARLSLLQEGVGTPDSVQTTHNVTCEGLHEYLTDAIDPFTTLSDELKDVTHLAVGDNSALGTSTTDTALNNEVYRAEVTSVAKAGGSATFTTLLDAGEANGFTIRELGLSNGPASNANAKLLNHATVTDETKTVQKTMTLDVSLTFADGGA